MCQLQKHVKPGDFDNVHDVAHSLPLQPSVVNGMKLPSRQSLSGARPTLHNEAAGCHVVLQCSGYGFG